MFKQKYSIIKNFEYFKNMIEACVENFSSLGARKHGPYTYETDYEKNHGRIKDSLESLIRHFSQMLTLECMDETIPHLHNMATRALMLNVRFYRNTLNLTTNKRIFKESNLIEFYNQFKLDTSIKKIGCDALWLPPELYIMIMKFSDSHIKECEQFKKDNYDIIYNHLKYVLERINSYLFILLNQVLQNQLYHEPYDIYNDISISDLLFYDIAILFYGLNIIDPKLRYVTHFALDQQPHDYDKLINYHRGKNNENL
jgi:hypothetical protein